MSSLDESRIRTILWAVRLIRSLQDQTHRSLRQLHPLHSQKRLQEVERTIAAELAELLSETYQQINELTEQLKKMAPTTTTTAKGKARQITDPGEGTSRNITSPS